MPNQVRSVVSGFDIAGSLRLSKFSKPFLMRCHMVRGIGVNEPYILRIGGTSRSRGRHRIFSMSHRKHSVMVFVVRVCGVIREFSSCGTGFTFLLSAFFFVVADFSTISTFGRVCRLGPEWKPPLLPNVPRWLPSCGRNWELFPQCGPRPPCPWPNWPLTRPRPLSPFECV